MPHSSAFNASAMACKLPDTRNLASASLDAFHVLSAQSLEAVKETLFRSHFFHQEASTNQLTTHQPEHHALNEPLATTALQAPPRTQLAQEPHNRAQEHIVYLVMQPIAAASKQMDDLRSKMHNYLGGAIDFPTLFAMLAVQHWAVSVDGHYYHLKRLIDDSLALDITPFGKATFLKVPLWRTKFSHEERAGIGAL
jgi:hypothetical protein